MVFTRKHERLVEWTDIPKKQVPIGTNYPAMRAKDSDKNDNIHRSYKPQLERWVMERRLRTSKDDGIVATIRKFLGIFHR